MGSAPVTGTATLCGWSDPTSFIGSFTAIVGQAPGRYQSDLQRITLMVG